MADAPKDQQKQSRQRRLSAALRDNLRRRKAQAKGRALESELDHADAKDLGESHDSAGIGEEKRKG